MCYRGWKGITPSVYNVYVYICHVDWCYRGWKCITPSVYMYIYVMLTGVIEGGNVLLHLYICIYMSC